MRPLVAPMVAAVATPLVRTVSTAKSGAAVATAVPCITVVFCAHVDILLPFRFRSCDPFFSFLGGGNELRLYFLCFHCLRRISANTRLTQSDPLNGSRRLIGDEFFSSAHFVFFLLTSFIFEPKRCWSKNSENQLNEIENLGNQSAVYRETRIQAHCDSNSLLFSIQTVSMCPRFVLSSQHSASYLTSARLD